MAPIGQSVRKIRRYVGTSEGEWEKVCIFAHKYADWVLCAHMWHQDAHDGKANTRKEIEIDSDGKV